MSIICEGCGQRVAIPEGYRRNKIQCGCGVICVVPESARSQTEAEPARPRPSPAVEEEAERWLLDEPAPSRSPSSEPPHFLDPEPDEPAAVAKKPPPFEMRFKCRRCQEPVRRQGECPVCDAGKLTAASGQEPIWCPSVDPTVEQETEDATPYGVEGADEVQCPKCCFTLPPASVLCVRCGFHLTKRKKVAKTYQPIERVWETNASLGTRRLLFAVLEIGALGMGLVGVVWGISHAGLFIFSSIVVTAMLAFLLGTFDRIHLTRDVRGRVQLMKTWRVCFFARAPQPIKVNTYEGIVAGQHRDISTWEYILCFLLLGSGVIPGILWWYFAIHKVTFHVSLSRDHNFPECIVYSGWDEKQMKEIAYSLRDASGLRYEEG